MEDIPGSTLENRIKDHGSLGTEDALPMTIALVETVGACHGANVVHRDDDAHDSNAAREVSPAEALATAGMQRGNLVTVRERDDGEDDDEPSLATQTPSCVRLDAVTHERFNLHASVHIEAHDDVGRERLCRYLNRPAFSLAHLGVRRGGNVSYRVKKATRGRVTQRVMTPIEALGRLAALVPHPRYPFLRFHGVVAPRHRWRDRVVPRPPVRAPLCKGKGAAEHGDAEAASGATPSPPTPRALEALEAGDGRAAFVLDALVATRALTTTGIVEPASSRRTSVSLTHWDRLLDGDAQSDAVRRFAMPPSRSRMSRRRQTAIGRTVTSLGRSCHGKSASTASACLQGRR